jgi:hypothetical protein
MQSVPDEVYQGQRNQYKVCSQPRRDEMSNESKALALARLLEAAFKDDNRAYEAAWELRRQHAEIDGLRAQLAARVPDGIKVWVLVDKNMEPQRWHTPSFVGPETDSMIDHLNRGFPEGAPFSSVMLSAAPSQQSPVAQGEPVAHLYLGGVCSDGPQDWEIVANPGVLDRLNEEAYRRCEELKLTLHLHPQQASEPMTLREIADATVEFAHVRSDYVIGIARAVERHHQIKGKQ